LELCRRKRRDFQGFHSHLILLTGNTEKAQVVEGLAAGADDYLTRPFHSGELVARVEVGRRIVELHREVQAKNRLLRRDGIDGLSNGFAKPLGGDVWASPQLSAAARHDFPFWVVISNLDWFKKVNDAYGQRQATLCSRPSRIFSRPTRASPTSAPVWEEKNFS
jgi:two-component system cell cycle response regulator